MYNKFLNNCRIQHKVYKFNNQKILFFQMRGKSRYFFDCFKKFGHFQHKIGLKISYYTLNIIEQLNKSLTFYFKNISIRILIF